MRRILISQKNEFTNAKVDLGSHSVAVRLLHDFYMDVDRAQGNAKTQVVISNDISHSVAKKECGRLENVGRGEKA